VIRYPAVCPRRLGPLRGGLIGPLAASGRGAAGWSATSAEMCGERLTLSGRQTGRPLGKRVSERRGVAAPVAGSPFGGAKQSASPNHAVSIAHNPSPVKPHRAFFSMLGAQSSPRAPPEAVEEDFITNDTNERMPRIGADSEAKPRGLRERPGPARSLGAHHATANPLPRSSDSCHSSTRVIRDGFSPLARTARRRRPRHDAAPRGLPRGPRAPGDDRCGLARLNSIAGAGPESQGSRGRAAPGSQARGPLRGRGSRR